MPTDAHQRICTQALAPLTNRDCEPHINRSRKALMKSSITNTPASLRRLIALGAATAVLSACAMAPGLNFNANHQGAALEADDKTTHHEPQVAISEIDVTLLKQMREAARTASSSADVVDHRTHALRARPGQRSEYHGLGSSRAGCRAIGAVTDGHACGGSGCRLCHRPARQCDVPFAGRVHVAGMRAEDAQAALAKALTKSFVEPQVTLRVASYRAAQVYVDGEIHTPGPQSINDIPMGLYEAISRAGGFSATADQSRMVLVRDGVSHSINLSQLLERGQNPSDIVLRNGDMLRVPARDESGVFVMGEVSKPSTALPMRNGKLTLADALAQAGSVTANSSDPGQVYVIRGSISDDPGLPSRREITRLDGPSQPVRPAATRRGLRRQRQPRALQPHPQPVDARGQRRPHCSSGSE